MCLDDSSQRSAIRAALALALVLPLVLLLDCLYVNKKPNVELNIIGLLLMWLVLFVFSVLARTLLNSDPIKRWRCQPVFELLFCLIACSPWLCCSYRVGSSIGLADKPEEAIAVVQGAIQELRDGSLVTVFPASVMACAWIKMNGQQSESPEVDVSEQQKTWRTWTSLIIGLLATFSLAYSAAIAFLAFAKEKGLYGKICGLKSCWKWCWLCIASLLALVSAWEWDQRAFSCEGRLFVACTAVFMILVFSLPWIPWIDAHLHVRLRKDGFAFSTLVFACIGLTFIALIVQLAWGIVSVVVASYVLLDGIASPFSECLPSLLADNGSQEDAK